MIITGSWNVTFNRKGKQNKYSLIVTSSLELPQEVLCPEAPGHWPPEGQSSMWTLSRRQWWQLDYKKYTVTKKKSVFYYWKDMQFPYNLKEAVTRVKTDMNSLNKGHIIVIVGCFFLWWSVSPSGEFIWVLQPYRCIKLSQYQSQPEHILIYRHAVYVIFLLKCRQRFFLPGLWLANCLRRAAVAAACWAETVTGTVLSVGGAPCLTVLVARAVLSAPLRLILLVGTRDANDRMNWMIDWLTMNW